MFTYVRQKTPKPPRPQGYNTVISACEKGWQGELALEFLEAMPKENLEANLISYLARLMWLWVNSFGISKSSHLWRFVGRFFLPHSPIAMRVCVLQMCLLFRFF